METGRRKTNLTGRIFRRRAGKLYCEGVRLERAARRFGTPVYVLSAQGIRTAARELKEAFDFLRPVICYAVKANDSLAVLGLIRREGFGAEVVSGGELFKALRAGIRGDKIVFSGVGKNEGEIRAALKARILLFNVESIPELEAIDRVARAMGKIAPVSLRINPNVDAHTHRYITTGMDENKFGISLSGAVAAYERAMRLRGVCALGIHCHIGSQITSPKPFVLAARRVNELLGDLGRRGIFPIYRNIGGGFGISYAPGRPRLNVRALARDLAPYLRMRGLQVIIEPGRFLVGEAGALLTRVVYVRRGARKTFVIVDAGMNDLLRPCLYEAYHHVVPCAGKSGRSRRVDVVGPVCESADFLALSRPLPPAKAGDLLAVLGAGAYGRAMASNYNGRPRAAEILVEGGKARVIRRRESYGDLLRGESE